MSLIQFVLYPRRKQLLYSELFSLMQKPALYEPSSAPFWNDQHISKGMLAAHLNAGWDAASRKHSFIDRSARWISEIAPPLEFPKLLDLGCGPGLYTERFAALGYDVTGIDFSERSISYAKEQSALSKSSVTYFCKDYLSIDYISAFDVITIIYCDYGALSRTARIQFLANVYRALRPGGKLILDAFTLKYFERETESTSYEYCEDGGFWSELPHLVLNATYRYPSENTILRRHIVLTDSAAEHYNIFECRYSIESLSSEISAAGFSGLEFFSDVAGKPYSKKSDTICGIFTK